MAALKRVLVTGAAGFAGSHIVEHLVAQPDTEVVALDALTYAGRMDNLPSCRFICWDFRLPVSDAMLKSLGPITHIIHNGAESHVARSFQNPKLFVNSNIFGTLNILEVARRVPNLQKFIYVSTDEVFGPARNRAFVETDSLAPTNPYAATKAAGEELIYAYFRSYGLPAIITRTMNMYGERQHVEKFVPKTIRNILAGKHVDIHTSPSGEVGTRHWLHASEQAQALALLLDSGISGESYNVSNGVVKSNLEIATRIAEILGKELTYRFISPIEPVHDLHYWLDDSKMKKLWNKIFNFDELFCQTVQWYGEHRDYLEESHEDCISGEL